MSILWVYLTHNTLCRSGFQNCSSLIGCPSSSRSHCHAGTGLVKSVDQRPSLRPRCPSFPTRLAVDSRPPPPKLLQTISLPPPRRRSPPPPRPSTSTPAPTSTLPITTFPPPLRPTFFLPPSAFPLFSILIHSSPHPAAPRSTLKSLHCLPPYFRLHAPSPSPFMS